jgi:hypothetical protein
LTTVFVNSATDKHHTKPDNAGGKPAAAMNSQPTQQILATISIVCKPDCVI